MHNARLLWAICAVFAAFAIGCSSVSPQSYLAQLRNMNPSISTWTRDSIACVSFTLQDSANLANPVAGFRNTWVFCDTLFRAPVSVPSPALVDSTDTLSR